MLSPQLLKCLNALIDAANPPRMLKVRPQICSLTKGSALKALPLLPGLAVTCRNKKDIGFKKKFLS